MSLPGQFFKYDFGVINVRGLSVDGAVQ